MRRSAWRSTKSGNPKYFNTTNVPRRGHEPLIQNRWRMVQPHHCLLTKRPIMSHIVVSLPGFNTIDLSCVAPPISCNCRTRTRAGPASFNNALIALYSSIKYNGSITSVLHQSCSGELVIDKKIMPPKARKILGVDEASHHVCYSSSDLENAADSPCTSTTPTPSTLCGTDDVESCVAVNQEDTTQSNVSTILKCHNSFQLIFL